MGAALPIPPDENLKSHESMTALPPLPDLTPGLYRHYKGNDYEVIAVARHSET